MVSPSRPLHASHSMAATSVRGSHWPNHIHCTNASTTAAPSVRSRFTRVAPSRLPAAVKDRLEMTHSAAVARPANSPMRASVTRDQALAFFDFLVSIISNMVCVRSTMPQSLRRW